MSSPSAITLFLSRRFSRVSSASASFSGAPRPEVFTSSDVASRAVSPASRFCRPPGTPSTSDSRGSGRCPPSAQLGDAVLAAQAFEHDPDLVLSRPMPPGRSPDVPDGLLADLGVGRLASHRSPSARYDGPETLLCPITSICPVGADGGQCVSLGSANSTVKRMVLDGRFPKPMRLSPRRIGWKATEVKAWIRQLDDQRKAPRQV